MFSGNAIFQSMLGSSTCLTWVIRLTSSSNCLVWKDCGCFCTQLWIIAYRLCFNCSHSKLRELGNVSVAPSIISGKLKKQSNNSVSSVMDKYCSLLYSNGVAVFFPSAFDPWSQCEKSKQHLRVPLGVLPSHP